jgi:hypothetical protein
MGRKTKLAILIEQAQQKVDLAEDEVFNKEGDLRQAIFDLKDAKAARETLERQDGEH